MNKRKPPKRTVTKTKPIETMTRIPNKMVKTRNGTISETMLLGSPRIMIQFGSRGNKKATMQEANLFYRKIKSISREEELLCEQFINKTKKIVWVTKRGKYVRDADSIEKGIWIRKFQYF